MDRQIIFAIAVALGSMLAFSGFFLSSAPSEPGAHPTYAPDDIRYKYQQADAKKPKRAKQTASAKGSEFAKSGKPSSSTTTWSSGGSDDDSSGDTSDGENEEPSLTDHEPQEEPALD